MGGKGVCQEMGDNAAIFADETSMGRCGTCGMSYK